MGADHCFKIRRSDVSGFDITIHFYEVWTIYLEVAESQFEFWLRNWESDDEWNRQNMESCIDLAKGLLSPNYRLRQWVREGRIRKSIAEQRVEGKWKQEAKTRWGFGTGDELPVLQNHTLPEQES